MTAAFNKVSPLSSVCALVDLVKSYEGQVVNAEQLGKISIVVESAFQEIKATNEPMDRDKRFVEIVDANLKVLNTHDSSSQKILPLHLDETAWSLSLAAESSKEQPLIGAGGFGYIYKMELPNGVCVARKTLRSDIDQCSLEQHINEIKIFFSISENPFVIGFFGVDALNGMILAYASNKDLYEWIHNRPAMSLSTLDMIRQIAGDCIEGIGYLHDRRIVHRDLKPENIFLMHPPDSGLKNTAKIGDLGLARLLSPEEWINPPSALVPGGLHMMPPEYIPAQGEPLKAPISIKADIWCFGGLIYMMFKKGIIDMNAPLINNLLIQGKIDCVEKMVDQEIAETIANCRKTLQGFGGQSLDLLLDLVRFSMQIDPTKRRSAQELIQIIADKTL